MRKEWDAVVIGTGPAGLAFASAAAGLGLNVLAVDEQAAPGGQIYRNIERQTPESLELLGADYKRGASLVREFRNSRAEYLPRATVWKIEADGRLCYSAAGRSHEIRAKRIVIAIGAMERPVPFPGWTLPGVMGAGAIDALYKSSGLAPKGPVAMVGSGPLMLSVAIHLHKMGVEISHFLDTRPACSTLKSLRHLPGALARPAYLLKGVGMLLKTGRIVGNRKTNVSRYAAEGHDCIEKLTFQYGKHTGEINTDTLLVHEGIVPRAEFVRQLDLERQWEPVQRYWCPKIDMFGRTSERNIYVAGDSGLVQGAVSAEKKGRLAAIDVAADLKGLQIRKKEELCRSVFRDLNHEIKPRPFIDAAYRPRPDLYAVGDDVMVCRCEEVTAGQIRQAVLQGMKTPETVKSITRCGMGPCQSRMCSSALGELVAAETGRMMQNLTPLSIRPPVRNLFIGELVDMDFENNPGGK